MLFRLRICTLFCQPGNISVKKVLELFFLILKKIDSNLPSKDTNNGVADPYVKVHYGVVEPNRNKQGSDLDQLGSSETIINDANPKWVKVFKVQYNKGFNQVYISAKINTTT